MNFSTRPGKGTVFYTLLIVSLIALGTVIQKAGNGQAEDDILPHPKRRRKREERGLPDKKTLRALAKTYLEMQRRFWPELAKSGILPRPTESNLAIYVNEFEELFLGRQSLTPFQTVGKAIWEALAAAYLRFSCDKSNPRSLVQQLKQILERAAQMKFFIPWQFIFADAGVTGTTNDRRGYELGNQAVENDDLQLKALFIDELGRANRDAVEALILGQKIDDLGMALIGASDGFDSRSPMAKFHLSIFAALHAWFSEQLASKVHRGMDDARELGTNLRPAAIGYRLEPAVDADGNPMHGRDGERLNLLVIDKKAAKTIRQIYDLYANRRWTRTRIARYLNEIKFGDQQWDATRIKQVLSRYKYCGIDVEKMTRVVRIKDANGKTKKKVVKRPRSEWKAKRARNLTIVSRKLWKAAQRRLADSAEAYASNGKRGKSRSEFNPTTLVRPICGCCGEPMALGRSGKYASFTCLNSREGKRGCTYRGYKTTSIVEDVILGFVLNSVLTEESIDRLVVDANEFLAKESAKPVVDTSDWKAEIKKLTRKRDRLTAILDEEGTEDLSSVVAKLRGHERRIRELRSLVQDAERSRAACRPMERADVLKLLGKVRELLNQEVEQAAPLLKKITGPVVVHLARENDDTRPTWTAEFSVNMVPVLAELAADTRCPSTSAWEYLNTRGWTMSKPVKCVIEKKSLREEIAADVAKLAEKHSRTTCAAILGINLETVNNSIKEANGQPPRKRPKKRRNKGQTSFKRVTFRDIAQEVARRKDEHGHTFERIAKDLGHSTRMIRRAYLHAHPEIIEEAIKNGEPPRVAKNSRLGYVKKEQMEKMVRDGARTCDIVRAVGCSRQTVTRTRKKIDGG